MRSTTTTATAMALVIGALGGCYEADVAEPADPMRPVGSSRAPKSPEAPGHPTNAFSPPHGDARAAFDRATERFARERRVTMPPSSATLAAAGTGALVLYDDSGAWGWLGELYALNVGALVSHFGTWTAKPASKYVAGELSAYAGAVYVGSTFDEPLPTTLLDDVLQGTRPVVWIDQNIWELAARAPHFATTYGFEPSVFDFGGVAKITYKGTALTRYDASGEGLMTYSNVTTAKVLAQALRTSDGTTIPWAVRGSNLTYIGENPMSYVSSNDRYLAFCDLLFDAFAPATPERHRALVRIEDVSADTDPNALRAIANYLRSQNVPFSVATIPQYLDPNGVENGGVPRSQSLTQAPQVASAIRYMTTMGGTVVLHGYTHQYAAVPNPYDGVTANDFEFYRAHSDAANNVVYDGPVPGDSQTWAAGRIAQGLAVFESAVLPRPTIFEFPHYAGSSSDSLAVRQTFATVYHRGLYFGGNLTGTTPNYEHTIGVMYPYVGTDIFGLRVIPENLGSYEPDAFSNNPPRVVADIIQTAMANRVVRDGFASFYFHPYHPLSTLQQLVTGVKSAGYTFVSPLTL